jgi:threonine dehydrogenase-like Zn-dependent dehydrogenase
MNKGLTVRGAQMHGQRYIPMLLERMARGELLTEHLATHTMTLEDGQRGYDIFKDKDRRLRAHGLHPVSTVGTSCPGVGLASGSRI